MCWPLAPHPSKFRRAGDLLPVSDANFQSAYSLTNKGLGIELPVEHQGHDAYGVATLHCRTYSTFPRQLALPVVRLGPPGTNHYARDARYIGSLLALNVKERNPKVVFMKQEPGLMVEGRLRLLANISHNTLASFPAIYFSIKVTQKSSGPSIEYIFPTRCRGAVLMTGHDQSHLLAVFNIEMQYVGRYARKVIYAGADSKTTPWEKRLHQLAPKVHEAGYWKEEILTGEVDQEPSWSLNHGDYGPSNSRSSFANLPNTRVLFAKITLDGEHVRSVDDTLLLQTHILDNSERPQEPYELSGSTVPSPIHSDAPESFTSNDADDGFSDSYSTYATWGSSIDKPVSSAKSYLCDKWDVNVRNRIAKDP